MSRRRPRPSLKKVWEEEGLAGAALALAAYAFLLCEISILVALPLQLVLWWLGAAVPYAKLVLLVMCGHAAWQFLRKESL